MKHLFFLAFVFIGILSFHQTCKGEEKKLKVLHLTFHKGCLIDFEGVANQLGLDVESWFIPDLPPGYFDGISQGNALYNIGHERAKRIWDLHQDKFNTFDVILTSDTSPLSRIFLQNDWKKPLIIWVCNRFDYTDYADLDCDFPDEEYYQLFREACKADQVTVIAYTAFERFYAQTKQIEIGPLIITPCTAYIADVAYVSAIPSHIIKRDTFFLPPYHNETKFMDLSGFLNKMGIQNYCGRYNGPSDLKDFKGIIHLPYGWSNLAFFENINFGIPYFVPSIDFVKELRTKGDYFYQDLPYLFKDKLYELSEWYNPDHQHIITYFDSWEDLKEKLEATDFDSLRRRIKSFSILHKQTMLSKWQKIFNGIQNALQQSELNKEKTL